MISLLRQSIDSCVDKRGLENKTVNNLHQTVNKHNLLQLFYVILLVSRPLIKINVLVIFQHTAHSLTTLTSLYVFSPESDGLMKSHLTSHPFFRTSHQVGLIVVALRVVTQACHDALRVVTQACHDALRVVTQACHDALRVVTTWEHVILSAGGFFRSPVSEMGVPETDINMIIRSQDIYARSPLLSGRYDTK